MNKKLVVGLFFGGRSVEHEVSVITALQAYENLDKSKYEVIPVYVSKDGKFYTNPKFLDLKNFKDVEGLLLSSTKITLGRKDSGQARMTQTGFFTQGLFPKFIPIDIAFPLFHGSFGEDGSIQGLFEIYQIPYVGFNVTGSAIAMDKVLSKALFKELGFEVAKYTYINRTSWVKDQKRCIKEIQNVLSFSMFVKPATLGSSIGVQKAKNEDELSFAIEVASTYCHKIIIEEAFGEDIIEVNCSALGYGADVRASVCEQPIKSEELLSFADKYQKGGSKGSKSSGNMAAMSRKIPAPFSEKLTKEIQDSTIKIFKAFDECGVARVDFFVDPKLEKFWVNEINSPPGSLAYYLWEKSGIKYKDLLDKLIEYAIKRYEDQKKTTYVFESGLLSQMAIKGGSKG